MLILPILLSPLYCSTAGSSHRGWWGACDSADGGGVTVLQIDPSAAIGQVLSVGDRLFSIDGHRLLPPPHVGPYRPSPPVDPADAESAAVSNIDSGGGGAVSQWFDLLSVIAGPEYPTGSCVRTDRLPEIQRQFGTACCSAAAGSDSSDPSIDPSLVCFNSTKGDPVCLIPKIELLRNSGDRLCRTDSDCHVVGVSCLRYVPAVKGERLLRIETDASPALKVPSHRHRVFYYTATASELHAAVVVTDIAIRSDLLFSRHSLKALWFPHMLFQFLSQLITISGSIAVLNCAPVYYADGAVSIELFAANHFPHVNNKRRIGHALRAGSLLLALNLFATLYAFVMFQSSHK